MSLADGRRSVGYCSCVNGTVAVAYRYAAPSALRGDGKLHLATSGGVTEVGPAPHPHFFAGFLAEPGPAAQALLATAAVARARYFDARALAGHAAADPVVTSNTDRLRFESFSACCGVHARLDLPPDALDGQPRTSGTTNVDFNAPMRAALAAAAASGSPMLLKVGEDEVTAATETTSVTERKVDLPARWVKGFGEVQALARHMRPVAYLAGADARRFIASLPRTTRRPLWAVPANRTLALSTMPKPGAACLAAPERLAELRPLLRFASSLQVYAPPVGPASRPAPSAWELSLGAARFTLTLSPERHRGFSGEGALLGELAAAEPADADLVGALLAWEPVIDVTRLAGEANLSSERTVVSLAHLAASGRVGYDLAEAGFFHRELPFAAAERDHSRLADARRLVACGAVTLAAEGAVAGGHRVTFASPHDLCTCLWWAKHQGTRGPCKHALAARIAASGAR
jgi:hypothetical protein